AALSAGCWRDRRGSPIGSCGRSRAGARFTRAPATVGKQLSGLDAAAVRVRPLVLITVEAINEGCRRPCALVVRLVAAAIAPCVEVGIGDRFARFMADE